MWSNSFPEGCSETSARARWCALFYAMIADGDAFGFSLGFTIFGETAVPFGGLAAVRNRRTRPDWKYLLGSKRRFWSAVTKPPNEVTDVSWSSREPFGGPDRRLKPPIVRFQGQFCLFTCPVLDVYKYHTFSFSELSSWLLRTLNLKERFLRENQIKNSFLHTQNHFHMH